MAALPQNTVTDKTTPIVCILASGRGTRMGPYGEFINKALLPYQEQAILSQIMGKFPKNSRFVISLGFKGEQVKNYLSLAHPQRKIDFAWVDNFDGPGSGPGYSLLQCKNLIDGPFYFVSCDTLWDGPLPDETSQNWMAGEKVLEDESAAYLNMIVESGKITEFKDKQKTSHESSLAFVGLAYIKDFKVFFQGLEQGHLISGERQVSNGFQKLVDTSKVKAPQIRWKDMGSIEKYSSHMKASTPFDFSKTNEFFYDVDGRILKFFADENGVTKRIARAQNQSVYPQPLNRAGQFFSYPKVPGKTLYQLNCPEKTFKALLTWLKKELWKPVDASSETFLKLCKDFYVDKTFSRIAAFEKKYPGSLSQESLVNGVRTPSWKTLSQKVPWDLLSNGKPTGFHGDLQFDNILYDDQKACFTLLDWRDSFAGSTDFGDQLYDMAKLRGGLILQYDQIKKNKFSYSETGSTVELELPSPDRFTPLFGILDEFLTTEKLSIQKAKLLVPIIYLNMSPLHTAPFDKFLFALGKKLLMEELGL